MNGIGIQDLLGVCILRGASDLHLSAGLSPMLRVHGDVQALHADALSHDQVLQMLHSLMSVAQREQFAAQQECDFAFEQSGLARFRVNAFMQQRGAAAVFRAIPQRLRSLDELGAPAVLRDLVMRPRGLVLVTGATGSGKSTTLAAMVEHLNQQKNAHVLCIEDPIEFVHKPHKCLINQREIGASTQNFAAALRSALREDPDVIVLGELRDLESIRLALTAAETGHLVLATLHTASAAQSIDRLVEVFSAGEKELVRVMLAECLQAVVTQTLCKSQKTAGRVAAFELLLANHAVRHLVREGKTAQLYSALQSGATAGMKTLDQSLLSLVQQGLISKTEARSKARAPEAFADTVASF
jgi:twitching motility protein PilT